MKQQQARDEDRGDKDANQGQDSDSLLPAFPIPFRIRRLGNHPVHR
jgi:hypothetical protein